MAMYPSGDVREILYGTYNPLSEDCLSEEFCAQQLTMAETVTPRFDPYYNIRYSHPESSRRVKYLKKLIHNAAIEYLNTQIQDPEGKFYKAYERNSGVSPSNRT